MVDLRSFYLGTLHTNVKTLATLAEIFVVNVTLFVAQITQYFPLVHLLLLLTNSFNLVEIRPNHLF